MPNTIGYKFGDVVLVPFPFTNQLAVKRRPAVIVSSDAYHRERPDVIVVSVTSRTGRPPGVGDVMIEEWRDAGLLKTSLIKPVFATIEQALILRRLGTLQDKDMTTLRQTLQEVLG